MKKESIYNIAQEKGESINEKQREKQQLQISIYVTHNILFLSV